MWKYTRTKTLKLKGINDLSKTLILILDQNIDPEYCALLLWQITVACHYGRIVVLSHCGRVVALWNYGRVAVSVWYNRKVGAVCHCGRIIALIVAACNHRSAVQLCSMGQWFGRLQREAAMLLWQNHPWPWSSKIIIIRAFIVTVIVTRCSNHSRQSRRNGWC